MPKQCLVRVETKDAMYVFDIKKKKLKCDKWVQKIDQSDIFELTKLIK